MQLQQYKDTVRRVWIWTRENMQSVRNWCMYHIKTAAVLLVLALFLVVGTWMSVQQPPAFFPIKTIVTIPEGVTLSGAADILKAEQVIKSTIMFKVVVMVMERETAVQAGDYYFDTRLTVHEVAERITQGMYGLEPVRVRIPEGSTTYQMSEILAATYEKFDIATFFILSKDKEGYLFPDTYFFLPNVTTEEIVRTMETTFYERLRSIEEKVALFGRPVHEIVTMASLLEKEAREYEERRTIAGVLWRRIAIEMPLQVDAVFGFIERTETFSPLFSDLEIESPYNTYKYVGLPPGPIGSPSFESLEAAISPVETDALFYLHGRDGVLRIAQTYDQHLSNRRRYLD